MGILKWEKRFEHNIAPFDDHHKFLVALLNDIYDDINNEAAQETLGPVIVKLIDYTNYHFTAEESVMSLNGYGDFTSHCLEHEKFRDMVASFQSDFQQGKDDSIDVLSFLGNWLFDHILVTDLEYCNFADTMKIES
jgi:hemerythrin